MDEVIGAKVSEDLSEEIESHRETDEPRSQTIRRLIRAGIEHETECRGTDSETTDQADSQNVPLSDTALLIGGTLLAIGYVGNAEPVVLVLGAGLALYGLYERHQS
jgi:hypothetical protein